MSAISVVVARCDELPAFGAFMPESLARHGKKTIQLGDAQALVLLNVEAAFTATDDGERAKRVLIETLMHEFGHVLEQTMGLEFDEDWIERVCGEFRIKAESSVVVVAK